MYYPATLASLTALGSPVVLPHNGDLWLAARLLLPFFSRADRRLRGDCLVANARVEH